MTPPSPDGPPHENAKSHNVAARGLLLTPGGINIAMYRESKGPPNSTRGTL